ncbi:MAG TPA: phenylacetate--CoA ligase [Candidatus Omnitrophota bacterium]|nr:phenylacetate--CoA ligase [Candidatus Omnitrophota bacterium]
MIYNEKMECLAPGALKDLQSGRLRQTVKYLHEHSPFYRTLLNESGVSVPSVKSIDDISRLPFTVKDDMRQSYPFGIFSSKMSDIRELHVSSGTTGNPVVVGYSKEDLDFWAEVTARALCCAGAVPGDMIQIAYGYGLFTGGLGLHYGSTLLGLTVIPCSAGQTRRQVKLLQDFKPRILACTPSYSLHMAEIASEMGLDTRQNSLEIGIFGAEPWSDTMRRNIENCWDIRAIDIYGLSEIIGPGVACECHFKNGLHVPADVFYPEVIDPKTLKPVAPGCTGELVITTLTKTGMPLLRYRTRDLVSINYGKCDCGRTMPRISKVLGRTDDMIVVRGINIFPSQIEGVLLGIKGTQPHYQIVVEREKGLDKLTILVEMDQSLFSDKMKQLQAFEEKAAKEVGSVLSISVKVKLVEPKSIERSESKAKRIIDKRIL